MAYLLQIFTFFEWHVSSMSWTACFTLWILFSLLHIFTFYFYLLPCAHSMFSFVLSFINFLRVSIAFCSLSLPWLFNFFLYVTLILRISGRKIGWCSSSFMIIYLFHWVSSLFKKMLLNCLLHADTVNENVQVNNVCHSLTTEIFCRRLYFLWC